MPKWCIVMIASVLAGVLGFICGALLTNPKRSEFET